MFVFVFYVCLFYFILHADFFGVSFAIGFGVLIPIGSSSFCLFSTGLFWKDNKRLNEKKKKKNRKK